MNDLTNKQIGQLSCVLTAHTLLLLYAVSYLLNRSAQAHTQTFVKAWLLLLFIFKNKPLEFLKPKMFTYKVRITNLFWKQNDIITEFSTFKFIQIYIEISSIVNINDKKNVWPKKSLAYAILTFPHIATYFVEIKFFLQNFENKSFDFFYRNFRIALCIRPQNAAHIF